MPDTVVMMLNRWIWLPLIHIMKQRKATDLNCPYARPFSAACLVATSAPPAAPLVLCDAGHSVCCLCGWALTWASEGRVQAYAHTSSRPALGA
jgi:hypothetical protein